MSRRGKLPYGRDWTLEHATRRLRPAVEKVLDLAEGGLARDGGEIAWGDRGLSAGYRGAGRFECIVSPRNVCCRFRAWLRSPGRRARLFQKTLSAPRPEQVDAAFAARFRALLRELESLVNGWPHCRWRRRRLRTAMAAWRSTIRTDIAVSFGTKPPGSVVARTPRKAAPSDRCFRSRRDCPAWSRYL